MRTKYLVILITMILLLQNVQFSLAWTRPEILEQFRQWRQEWSKCYGMQDGWIMGIPIGGGSYKYKNDGSGMLESFSTRLLLPNGDEKTIEIIGPPWQVSLIQNEIFPVAGKYALWLEVVKIPQGKKRLYYYDVILIGRTFRATTGKSFNEVYPASCD